MLLGVHYPWDLQTFYNMFADLARGASPYGTFRSLSGVAGALSGIEADVRLAAYESCAYPPLPALLYWPLAKLVAFKVPLWISDVAIAALLWRVAGEDAARAFSLNPLIVLVTGAWTIDTLMVLPTLAAFYTSLRGRCTCAGFLLAVGVLVKWLPVIFWPTVGIWLWNRRIPAREQLSFHGAFPLLLAIGLVPWWPEIVPVLRFHAERPGAHLTAHALVHLLQAWKEEPGWSGTGSPASWSSPGWRTGERGARWGWSPPLPSDACVLAFKQLGKPSTRGAGGWNGAGDARGAGGVPRRKGGGADPRVRRTPIFYLLGSMLTCTACSPGTSPARTSIAYLASSRPKVCVWSFSRGNRRDSMILMASM